MVNHKKPTEEELKAQQQIALETDQQEGSNDDDKEDEKETSESNIKPTIEEETINEEEIPEDKPNTKITSDEKDEEIARLKKRKSDSDREAQKIIAKNRVINKALADAEDVTEPTEEELKQEYPDWDVMSDTERKFAQEAVISKKWRTIISQAKQQATKIEKWNQTVKDFIDDPATYIEHPDLEGKTTQFMTFATDEKNNNVPMNILVSAFLHDNSINRENNKGKMFERGKGGDKQQIKSKDGTISLEEARILRENDYNKWKEYVKAGKIKQDF